MYDAFCLIKTGILNNIPVFINNNQYST